jgi:hypothetical protein
MLGAHVAQKQFFLMQPQCCPNYARRMGFSPLRHARPPGLESRMEGRLCAPGMVLVAHTVLERPIHATPETLR